MVCWFVHHQACFHNSSVPARWYQHTFGESGHADLVAGIFGLKFVNLKEKLSYLKQFEPVPKFLVIHCGGNDIEVIDLPLHKLITIVRNHVQLIKQQPGSILVRSQILPRKNWRYSQDNASMEKFKLKVKSVAAKSVLRMGGGVLHIIPWFDKKY